MMFGDRLAEAVRRTRSATCVGIDPRSDQLPETIARIIRPGSLESVAAAYTQFGQEIIDAVADLVPCVKPQAAFFEQLGPAGMVALGEVIRHARRAGLLVILDGKRNDIGSTATAYADAYLGSGSEDDSRSTSPWGCDALTVSPYLGRDSLEPFVEVCGPRGAGIFVLVKTSNPGGGYLQDESNGDTRIYERVADLVTELNAGSLGDHGFGPVGAVVGATYPEQLAELRTRMPHSWILIPGFGAQGGAAEDVRAGFREDGLGAVVNNSRHLIFAYRRPEFRDRYGDAKWQEAVREATTEMNQAIRAVVPLG